MRLSDSLAERVDGLAMSERRTRSSAIVVLLERGLNGAGLAELDQGHRDLGVTTDARKVVPASVSPSSASPAFSPVASAPKPAICGHPDPLSETLWCRLEPGHKPGHSYGPVKP